MQERVIYAQAPPTQERIVYAQAPPVQETVVVQQPSYVGGYGGAYGPPGYGPRGYGPPGYAGGYGGAYGSPMYAPPPPVIINGDPALQRLAGTSSMLACKCIKCTVSCVSH